MKPKDSFQLLVQNLQLCPTAEATITPKLVNEIWDCMRDLKPQHGDEVTPAMLVALILFDENSFADPLTDQQLDQNKAQALGNKYGCQFLPEWYAKGKVRHYRHDWLLCLVDNHRTRLEVLEVCDDTGCQAIFAANEMHSSEAYYYRRQAGGMTAAPA